MLGIGVGIGSAHAVMDVHGRDVVAERTERVPEAGRVGTARDEARDAPTRLDELVGADERLDPRGQVGRHASSVTEGAVVPSRGRFSVAASATWSAGGSSSSSGLP